MLKSYIRKCNKLQSIIIHSWLLIFITIDNAFAQYGGGGFSGGGYSGGYSGGYYGAHHSTNSSSTTGSDIDVFWLIVIFVAISILCYFTYNYSKPELANIKIIKTPPGDNPQWVRAAWQGLVLNNTQVVRNFVGTEVVSNMAVNIDLGYRIKWEDAISALEKHDRKAAAWWKKNATPMHNRNLETLVFISDNVEVVK